MYGVSDRFRRALNGRHTVIGRATVLRNDQQVFDTPLTLIDGKSTIDSSANILTSGTITALDTSGQLSPDLVTRLIDVYTAELQLERGVRYQDGTEEVIPTGRVSLSKLSIGRKDGGVTFSSSIYDRAVRCQGPMVRPWVIEGGTLLEDALPPLLASRFPPLPFQMASTGFVLATQLLDVSKDAWNESLSYAKSGGQWLRMDRVGRCVMSPVPSDGSRPVWDYSSEASGDQSPMVNATRNITNDRIPNVVVVYGTNPAAPGIRAEAWDDNPQSPTYRYGPYGEVVLPISEPRIATQDQAQAMANAKLLTVLGPGDTIEFDAVPNPALDPYDTIRCVDEGLGIDGYLYTITRIDGPHRARGGLMHVTATQSIGLAGEPTQTGPNIVIGYVPPTPPAPSQPDLTADAVNLSPSTPTAGDAITFSVDLTNIGDAAAPGGVVKRADFYVDGVLVAWSINTTTAINAGASTTLTADHTSVAGVATWPATAGSHTVEVVLDPGALLDESDTTNNRLAVDFVVTSPVTAPDLIITALSFTPANPNPGDHVTMTATVKNIGNANYTGTPPLRIDFEVDGALAVFKAGYTTAINVGASVNIDADTSV